MKSTKNAFWKGQKNLNMLKDYKYGMFYFPSTYRMLIMDQSDNKLVKTHPALRKTKML